MDPTIDQRIAGLTNATVIADVTHAGRRRVVVEHDQTNDLDGSTYRSRVLVTPSGIYHRVPGGETGTVEKVLLAELVELAEDDKLRPELTRLIHAVMPVRTGVTPDGFRPATVADLAPGRVAYVQATARYRRGQIVTVGPKRATVAYTTASSNGRVYRKAVAHGALLVTT